MFLYVPGLGWLFWEGGRWNRDLKRRAFDAMRKTARERASAAIQHFFLRKER